MSKIVEPTKEQETQEKKEQETKDIKETKETKEQEQTTTKNEIKENSASLEQLFNEEQDKLFLAKQLSKAVETIKELTNKYDELHKSVNDLKDKKEEKKQSLNYVETQQSSNNQEQTQNDIDPISQWKKIMELNKKGIN